MNATQTIPQAEANALAVQAGADSTEITKFESEALSLAEEAKAITITDQDSYNLAVDTGNRIAGFQKRWKEWIQRPYDVVYGAYKAVLAMRKAIEDPPEEGKKFLGRSIQAWDAKQEQLRREQEIQLEEKQRQEEEARRIDTAAAAEQAGLSEAAVEQILAEPSVAPRPVAPPTYQRSTAVSTRENWAGEVTDLHALIKAVAKNKTLVGVLQVNQPALNSLARIHKQALATVVPGTRGVNKGATAFRQAR